MLDEALGHECYEGHEDARTAAVDETAAICADLPDWPEWLRRVRGGGADDRLAALGL